MPGGCRTTRRGSTVVVDSLTVKADSYGRQPVGIDRRFSLPVTSGVAGALLLWAHFCGQLRLSCPWKLHTLHFPE